MKKVVILGGGGFIGGHLAHRLLSSGNHVIVVDLKKHTYFKDSEICNEFIIGDLRDMVFVSYLLNKGFDEVYQLASDVGGAGYISTGENDADIMTNSARININVARLSAINKVGKLFFSSSSCVYPEPDGDYGFEKLFSERLYSSYNRNCGLDIRIGRFQNVYGMYDSINGIKERCIIALCRKIALAHDGDSIEVWGDGRQTRYFIHVEDVVRAIIEIMDSSVTTPINIGSNVPVSINDIAKLIIDVSKNDIRINNIYGNEFIKKYGYECPVGLRQKEYIIGWCDLKINLIDGLSSTYEWVKEQIC